MDDLRLYDRTLTQSDVTTIYGGGNGDFVSVRTGSSVSIKKAGSVTLTAHAPATASMNAAALVNQTITVSKAPLTITGDSLTMNQGGSVPSLTYQITGYKYSDSESDALSTGVTMTTDATSSSVAGNYYTRPAAATSDKYFINFVDGVLVVTSKTPQSIHGDRIFQMHRSISSLILTPPPVRACQWSTRSISRALLTWRSPTRAAWMPGGK